MNLIVNGQPREVPDGLTTAQLVQVLELPDRGVAVAVDGTVMPRSRWDDGLRDDASIEVLTAVQGG